MKRPARDKSEDGTVLLTTLFVMAIMAVITVEIMDDIRFAVKRTVNVGDYAQADWYMKGAEDFARSYIGQNLTRLPKAQKNRFLQKPQSALFPFDGGSMQIEIRDGSHCLSLGGIVTGAGKPDDVGIRQITGLMGVLGWPDNEARAMGAIMSDWADSDSTPRLGGAEDGDYMYGVQPSRTANSAFGSVMELRALKGMSEEYYQTLRPFLCARPAGRPTQFNINTAGQNDVFVLAAILGGQEFFQTAARLIAERPQEGYSQETFKTAPALSDYKNQSADFNQSVIFEPQNIWMEVRVDYRNATRLGGLAFDLLDNRGANLTYRGWGAENFRPILDPPEQGDAASKE